MILVVTSEIVRKVPNSESHCETVRVGNYVKVSYKYM